MTEAGCSMDSANVAGIPSPLVFGKYQALGNDFVVVDARFFPAWADDLAFAQALLDRHFGAGADDCIFVLPSGVADVRMRIRTPAGGWLSMCGNGIRCLARHLHDSDSSLPQTLRIETDAGVRETRWLGDSAESIEADLHEPDLRASAIPTDLAEPGATVLDAPLNLGRLGTLDVSCVSVGNPHAVTFVPELGRVDMGALGYAIEHHAAFPSGVNVHAAQIIDRGRARIRTWERGAGLTLA
jgi:diaminopimelate epimerase